MYVASFWREREDVAQPVDGREREVRPRAVECGRGGIVEVLIVNCAARYEEKRLARREGNQDRGLVVWLASPFHLRVLPECGYDRRYAT